MEVPKDYSTYCEEQAPVPASRSSTTTTKTLDGDFRTRRHNESRCGGINPNELLPRLYNLCKEQHKAVAHSTLQQHYNQVFQKRNQQTYKVYLNYMVGGKNETYLVRVNKNTLKDVKEKLPIKGEYRLFFIHPGNELEEVEDDDSVLPYQEKDGAFNIYCRVFGK